MQAEGLSNDEIAKRMVIESASVADNLTHVYARMGILEEFADLRPNRLLLISVFAPFFSRYPDMRNDEDELSALI